MLKLAEKGWENKLIKLKNRSHKIKGFLITLINFHDTHSYYKLKLGKRQQARSCKRREILFQKSLLLFSTWKKYFYSQPTHFSSQSKDLNKVSLLLQDLGQLSLSLRIKDKERVEREIELDNLSKPQIK